MGSTRFYLCCLAACLAVVSATSDKQIKLEDIEKDTLKAAQQAKYEKQLQQAQQQQQQQQQPQYQQTTYQYDPQTYSQQSVTYQAPASYSQYLYPQQYYPQSVVSAYGPLTSNSLGAGYATPSAHAFQTYLSPQLTTIPSVSSFHTGQSLAAASTQTQPLVVTFGTPSLTTFQQPYYQGALQYYPAQTAQATQFYYTPQADQASSTQLSSSFFLPTTQQYYTSLQPTTTTQYSYQPLTSIKGSTSYAQQYVSTAPQTFPQTQTYAAAQQDYSTLYSSQTYTPQTYTSQAYTPQTSSSQTYSTQAYSPQTYSSNTLYSNTATDTPTFVTVKAPQHLVASQGQQQQYQQQTTISPIQAKYLNSPQYLAQNYNTIQSSHLYPKGSLSSGVKSTVSPPIKGSGSSPFGSNSYGSASSSVSSYVPFRSLPSKNY